MGQGELKYIALEQSSKESYMVGVIVFRLYTLTFNQFCYVLIFPTPFFQKNSEKTPLIDLRNPCKDGREN